MKRQNRKHVAKEARTSGDKDQKAERVLTLLGVPFTRRRILLGSAGLLGVGAVGLLASHPRETSVASGPELVLYRDPGCGCCKKWAEGLEGAFTVRIIPSSRLHEVRQRLGVPGDLAGCHTATVDGLVVEGHVPLEDIKRALRERSPGVLGLAVPGMPIGSPDMETDDGPSDPYEVIAFGADGQRSTFASYGR